MDRKFYTESFERLLKEKSDEFRMYPVKRVWHSIYNDLYPGRRYPSVIMSIAIISALSLISFLNINHVKTSVVLFKPGISINNVFAINNIPSAIHKGLFSVVAIGHENNLLVGAKSESSAKNIQNAIDHSSHPENISSSSQSFVHHTITQLPFNKNFLSINKNNTGDNVNTTSERENNIESTIKNPTEEKNKLPDYYSINNNHFSKRWTDKLVWQIYASPYLAYGEGSVPKSNSVQGQENNSSFDNSSIGLEAGTAMQYSLSGLIKLKAGVQFNYASYNMEAYQNDINNDITDIIQKTGFANNGISTVTLHNEMYQFSLPVGLEFKLFQKKNLQWNAGATIQPTFIAGGNTYLLSSDTHNFIDQSSALNKWNFNAGLETFITYKVNGLTWQFGPQLRYQFASIYGKAYTPIDEKLTNFGFKIGVSKVIR